MGTPPAIVPPPPKRSPKPQQYMVGTTTGTTLSVYNLQAMLTKASNNTIQDTYHRCRVYQEWSDSKPNTPADVEPDVCEYIVRFQSLPNKFYPDYNALMTWERWCAALGEGDDVESAFRLLRSLSKKLYRLKENPKSGKHTIMFATQDGALACAEVFGKAIGMETVA